MSKKCRAYSDSKIGLAPPDNRKAFYAGWDAAIKSVNHVEICARAIVEKEREHCAQLCDAEATIEGIAQRCAEAIRERGRT